MIKGKPAQTYLNPDRKWIFGAALDNLLLPILRLRSDQFGNLSVFQFDPGTFQLTQPGLCRPRALGGELATLGLQARLGARSARPAIESYRTFDVSTFAAISEPPTYFKKEVKQSSEMNYEELRRYIHDLQQSGFDVVRLRVQLQKSLLFR